MSDELDDDIGVDEFGDEAFDDFEGGDSLGGMSRDNPLVKIGMVIGAFAVIVFGIMLFGGEKIEPKRSVMGTKSEISQVPGEETSEVYKAAQEEVNVERVERAIEEKRSAIPTPTATAKAEISLEDQKIEDAEDPLERWRRIQEERQKKEQELPPAQEAEDDGTAEATNALSEAMMSQMQAILDTKAAKKKYMGYELVSEPEEKDEEEGDGDKDGEGSGSGGKGDTPATILLPAGTIEYGQLLIEASTDAPGPVLAQVASGPLAGSKLIGSFESTENYLVISFDTIVVDGVSYSIDAVALDPDTTLPGMATEVDKRYFSRYVLPAAAAFVSGVGSAIAQTGVEVVATDTSTTVTAEEPDFEQEIFKGVEDLANKVEEIVDEQTSQIEPLIRVAAGTAMGILFIEPVVDETQ